MEADKIRLPTLIIWGEMIRAFLGKMVNCIISYLRIARSILLKRIPRTVSPGTNRVYGICTSVLRRRIHNNKILSINPLLSSYSETNKGLSKERNEVGN